MSELKNVSLFQTSHYYTPDQTSTTIVSDDSCFKTPCAFPLDDDHQQDSTSASARQRLAIGLEKSRAEARARARLKSDEELCLAVKNRSSGARYRSSSLRDQVLARTKSHEVLSPRNSNSIDNEKGENNRNSTTNIDHHHRVEPLKRKTYSEELTTKVEEEDDNTSAIRRSSTPKSIDDDEIEPIDNSPIDDFTPIVETKSKPKSFLSKLLSPFSPTSSTTIGASTATSTTVVPVVASESNKETSLLSKIGWKYGPNKRRSRGSLSPQQSFDNNKIQEETLIVKAKSTPRDLPKPSGKLEFFFLFMCI